MYLKVIKIVLSTIYITTNEKINWFAGGAINTQISNITPSWT